MEFLEILNGISPWWWVALALGLGALEMATMSFFLIWPALSALIVAGLLYSSPDMSGSMQITIFAIAAMLLTVLGRIVINRYGDGGGNEDSVLNDRGKRFVGRTGTVLEFANGHGIVEVEGMRWRANFPQDAEGEIGSQVRIISAEGLTLKVEPLIA